MVGCKFLLSKCVAVSAALACVLICGSALYAQPNAPGLNIPTHCVVGTESYRDARVGVQQADTGVCGVKSVEQKPAGTESYRSRFSSADTYSTSVAGIQVVYSQRVGRDTYTVSVTARESYRLPRAAADTHGTKVCGMDTPCR